VAERNTAIRGLQIKDNTIKPVKIDATNAPTDGYYLAYDGATQRFVWKDVDAMGVLESDVICNEIPSGAVDGSNTTYTLANIPAAGTVEVYLNGLLQEPGSGKDYTISGNTITFALAPEAGDILLCSYIISP